MLRVNNESLIVELESRLADSGGKEWKSSSTVQLNHDLQIGYIRLTVGWRFRHYINICLCYCRCPIPLTRKCYSLLVLYYYTGSCQSIGRIICFRNLHRWGQITFTYHLCIVQSIMGHHYYTPCISHLIVSRFKVQVQHVQMAHALNSEQNGGYEFQVQISPLWLCTRPCSTVGEHTGRLILLS